MLPVFSSMMRVNLFNIIDLPVTKQAVNKVAGEVPL